uniref:WAP domain-containing protein n=1 Tax=Ficedula albicollis TaxID=59894 RepID=A0A803V204_FICAL
RHPQADLDRAVGFVLQDHVPSPAGSAWSCPPVRFTCALHNPRNQCLVDRHCPRGKKCCRSFCGKKCLSNLKQGQ